MKTKRIISGLLSVLLCLSLIIGMIPMIPAVHAEATTESHTGHDGWEIISTSDYITTVGSYYLEKDLTLTKAIRIQADIKLCLNGCTLTSASTNALIVDSGYTVTLCDCSENQTGTIQGTSNAAAALIHVGGTLDMYGGTITGNTTTANGGGVHISAGTFNMYGGAISGNTGKAGGGVFINSNGTFTMHQGTISENKATDATYGGGGVCLWMDSSKFVMKNGTISGNTATNGGGVYSRVAGGEITMENGTISDNTATTNGGGICNAGTLTMSNGTISGNKAQYGGGVYNTGTFEMTGGEISSNRAEGAISSSDGITTISVGGGVYNKGSLTIDGATATIKENYADHDGGAINSTGTVEMKSGSITGNTLGKTNCGGVKVEGGSFKMTGGSIDNDTDDVRVVNTGTAEISGSSNFNYIRVFNNGSHTATATIKNLTQGANISAVAHFDTGETFNNVFAVDSNDQTIFAKKISDINILYTYNPASATQARMVLGSSLNMQFKLPVDLVNEIVKVNGETATAENGIVTVYRNPAQMEEDIVLTIGDYTYTDSVQDYAKRQIAKTDDQKLKNVLIDMLNYGEAAYKYKNNQDQELTSDDSDTVTTTVSETYNDSNASLSLGDNFVIKIATEEAEVGDDATYKFDSFLSSVGTPNVNTQVEEITVNGETKKAVVVDQIALADAFNAVTVTVGDHTYTDSVAAYCQRQINDNTDDANLVALCQALLKFATAAQAYLAA